MFKQKICFVSESIGNFLFKIYNGHIKRRLLKQYKNSSRQETIYWKKHLSKPTPSPIRNSLGLSHVFFRLSDVLSNCFNHMHIPRCHVYNQYRFERSRFILVSPFIIILCYRTLLIGVKTMLHILISSFCIVIF